MNPLERKYTPEEIKEMEENTRKHCEEKLPTMRLQAEYEETLARIAEARFKQYHYQTQLVTAQAQNMPPEGKETK